MALDDDQILIAAQGFIYIAPVGTTAPATNLIDNLDLNEDSDLSQVTGLTKWVNVGHTSRDDMPEFGFEGGQTNIRGSWQKQRLREVYESDPIADHVVIRLEQWNEPALELYYGKNDSSVSGHFGVSGLFIPTEYALLMVIVDGEANVGFHAPRVSWRREEGIDLSIDNLSTMPVRGSFLDYKQNSLYTWISADLMASGGGSIPGGSGGNSGGGNNGGGSGP